MLSGKCDEKGNKKEKKKKKKQQKIAGTGEGA